MFNRSVVTLCLIGASLGFALPYPVNIGFQNNGKIIGGEDAQNGEFPWQVSLLFDGGAGFRPNCGGSILDATHILSAAHCADGRDVASLLIVAGAHNISNANETSQQRILVRSYRIHENFDSVFTSHDISILELETPLEFNEFVQPASLCQDEPSFGSSAVNTGWGNTNPQPGTPMAQILQKVTLTSIDRPTCMIFYPLILKDHMLCAIGFADPPSGACTGDAGNPLMYTPQGSEGHCVVGITSFTRMPCGSAPSVYTSIPFFLDWIAENAVQAID